MWSARRGRRQNKFIVVARPAFAEALMAILWARVVAGQAGEGVGGAEGLCQLKRRRYGWFEFPDWDNKMPPGKYGLLLCSLENGPRGLESKSNAGY